MACPLGTPKTILGIHQKKNLFEKEEELKYSRVVFCKQKGKKINSNSFSYLQ
jgi:hypothetical protein